MDFCEHVNELSGSVKDVKFLDFFKKHSGLLSQLVNESNYLCCYF
jgi:hypothetical protein